MIGAVNLRWLQRRAQHHANLAFRSQLDEALAARRAGRAERSVRTAKGWPTRIQETYERDLLIRYKIATTPVATAAVHQMMMQPSLPAAREAACSASSSGNSGIFARTPLPNPLNERDSLGLSCADVSDDTLLPERGERPEMGRPSAIRETFQRDALVHHEAATTTIATSAMEHVSASAKILNHLTATSRPPSSLVSVDMARGSSGRAPARNGSTSPSSGGDVAADTTIPIGHAQRWPTAIGIYETFQRDALLNQGARA